MKKLYINYYPSKNFGDALNPVLIKFLLKRVNKEYKIIRYNGIKKILIKKPKKEPIYLVIGSILSWAKKENIIWGAGFISADSRVKEKPRKVLAVRGPLSRKKLIEQKIECPEVYGDPALLLPILYFPKVKKKYKLGIIPHYVDQNSSFIKKIKQNKNILIIDINSNIKKVVKDILSCEKIASSSLHGIIVSDAYGIPSTWLEFSNKVIGKGFKFKDYFLFVKRKDKKPLIVTTKTTISNIENKFYKYKIDIDLKKLLETCPFNNLI